MFIDKGTIWVKAGDGGNGSNSFYLNKRTRRRCHNGGDGGKGGDVVFKVDRNLQTLLDFKYRRHFHANSGGHGSGNKKRGVEGQNLIIKVPQGTLIKDAKNGFILRDLVRFDEELIAARGGKGGSGNSKFHQATNGERGEDKYLILELKLIADVGVIGYPNAGKSTFLSRVSKARPKIASFPFTTISPVLGVVNRDVYNFTVADIPGLIEGAHEGKGLGYEFLRHIERTKILLHIIDMAGVDGRDPVDDYKCLNKELQLYGLNIEKKIQILVANKMDINQASENLKNFKAKIKKKIYQISALKGDNLDELIDFIGKKLKLIVAQEEKY